MERKKHSESRIFDSSSLITTDPSKIREMFNRLVPEYDQFNKLSSFGLDRKWRKSLASKFKDKQKVLDIGTGTGDLANAISMQGPHVVGVDFSDQMIEKAKLKYVSNSLLQFYSGKANSLQFDSGSFDGISSSFVIRNLFQGAVLEDSAKEFFRVLKTNGLMAHLELTRPKNALLRNGHGLYLKTALPFIGRFCFGNRWPQDYLNQTIHRFPSAEILLSLFEKVGFKKVGFEPLFGGVAGIFWGIKC